MFNNSFLTTHKVHVQTEKADMEMMMMMMIVIVTLEHSKIVQLLRLSN